MKRKLHIHSDNSYWAGSENMAGVFLQDPELNEQFDVSFSFRYTPEYEAGMRKWVPGYGHWSFPQLFPVNFPITYCYKIRPYFKPIMVLGYTTALIEIMKMGKLMKKLQPDILHVLNGGYPGASSCNSAAIAAKMAGVKQITYFITSTARNPWWYRWMTPLVKKSVNRFMSASENLRDQSRFLWWADVPFWRVIPNTVLWKNPAPRDEVRNYLGISPNDVMFLGMGAFEERKGFYRLVEAMDHIPPNEVPRLLILYGKGPEHKVIKNKALKSNSLIGFVDPNDFPYDDYSLMNACDCLVVPSLYDEDCPNVIVIAEMYGKPVIASAIAGIPEMINGNGILVQAGNVKQMGEAMGTMLDYNFREAKGKNSRANFDRQFSRDVVIPKYIDLWG